MTQEKRISPFDDPVLVDQLYKMRREGNIEGFSTLLYSMVSDNPDAVSSPESGESKRGVLTEVIDYFVSTEEYEKCALLRDVLEKMESNSTKLKTKKVYQ